MGSRTSLAFWLKVLSPYFAVVVFWVFLHNAWLALLAYHVQIVMWQLASGAGPRRLRFGPTLWMAIPFIAAGPALYLLLPTVVGSALSAWLAQYHLTGLALWIMVPYYGLVHPPLEELHWAPLRERTPICHVVFAGYHVIVLGSLLSPAYLALAFGVLAASSVVWARMAQREGGLLSPIASHVFADLGIIVAALLRST